MVKLVHAMYSACGTIQLYNSTWLVISTRWSILLACKSLIYLEKIRALNFWCSFLSDVERITARDYIPTDGTSSPSSLRCLLTGCTLDDILRARIKTIGVTEHKLTINTGASVPGEWLVYDVGGSRTHRAAWLPYFDTTDAIIFIASLSSFDEVLTEDPTVNRMVRPSL
jgi:guanine nucleotide-binding protein alpha-1 subunit